MKSELLFDVRGHVAVITAGAGGLGFAMAEVMADNGAKVVILDIDRAGIDEALGKLGPNAEGHLVDVADAAALRSAIDAAAAKHGRLDVVFANAGIGSAPGILLPAGQLELVKLEEWDHILHVNLTGTFVTIQAAAAHMKPRRSGRIVVTVSIAGLGGQSQMSYAYVATKAGAANLVRQAALELAPYNVLVNGIAPGPFRTNISGGRLKDPEIANRVGALLPINRLGQPPEIKGLALLLASPASSFMTGAVIPIDGGLTAS